MNINQLFSLAHHSLDVAEMQRNRFLVAEQEFQQLQQKKRLTQKHRELDTRIQKGEEVVEDEAVEDDAVLLQTIQSILGRGGE